MKLLDTDICIEILRGNPKVLERHQQTSEVVSTSWISAAELSYGAARSARPEHHRNLVRDLLSVLPIHGLDHDVARTFGDLKAKMEKDGHPLADADLWIGAICLVNGATLVTGNHRHFGRIPGLLLENWIRP